MTAALVLLLVGSAVPVSATSTSTVDQIQSVDLVATSDSDGDGYAASFELEIEADTSFDDTDTIGNNPGEPYFEVEIDGEEVLRTDVVARDTSYTTTLVLSKETLRGLEAGDHDVTVELWDKDDDFDRTDLGNDDRTSAWTGTLRYEHPATLEIGASRTTTVTGSPVSLRVPGGYDGTVEWKLVDAPSGSHAEIRAHYEQTATLRPDADGTYTVKVLSGTDDSATSATVTITARSNEHVELLRQYAPRIHFHRDATYFPTRYEAFVYHAALEDILSDNVEKPTMFDLAGRERYWELDLNGSEADFPRYDDGYPPTVYGSVHQNVEFRGHTYTAVTYWLFYLFDPKHADGVSSLLSHESDTETVTILVNGSGPQWVGASQHYGGERREWAKASTSGTHLNIYPALGAHSNYLRDTSAYSGDGILLQEQFVDHGSLSTELVELSSGTYRDRTGSEHVWTIDGSNGTDYQLVPLTGNEVWATYRGVFGKDDDAGQVPMRRTRWESPGEWLMSIPADEKQIVGSFEAVDWTVSDGGITAAANVSNPGSKPHPFWFSLEAKPVDASWTSGSVVELESSRVRVGTDSAIDVTLSGTPSEATGEWNVRLRLLAYSPTVSETEDVLADPVVASETFRFDGDSEVEVIEEGATSRLPRTTPAPSDDATGVPGFGFLGALLGFCLPTAYRRIS